MLNSGMEQKPVYGKRILLVDDDPNARHILGCLLSFDQHTVVEAANGKEACLVYAPGDFDLVITDYEMPEMKGDELARTLKCLVPSQRVIMITGMPWTLAGPENPVDAVLIKPVTLDEMRQYIATVLSRDLRDLPFRWSNTKSGKGIGLGLT
jgi:CheY-like chemotaxis protein